MRIGYYPGCALHGSSNDYEMSLRACMNALGADLQELDDWICCGASAAHCVNRKLSIALPARNLALAERDGLNELLAPCPLCSMELMRTNTEIAQDADLRHEMAETIELPIQGKTQVLNLIQVFQKIGLDKIKAAAKRELSTFLPACYYGCLLTRPPEILRFDDPDCPNSMETILQALGARTVDWNYKTECCGAGLTMANEDTVLDLSNKILSNASEHGANCVVVACPMCHVNLDMKQADINARHAATHNMPVYYLSELIGLAMGLEEKALGVNRHFVAANL